MFAETGSDVILRLRIKLVGTRTIHKFVTGKMSSPTPDYRKFSVYFESLSQEAQQRYRTKLVYDAGTKNLPDPYSITEKWSTNPNYLARPHVLRHLPVPDRYTINLQQGVDESLQIT